MYIIYYLLEENVRVVNVFRLLQNVVNIRRRKGAATTSAHSAGLHHRLCSTLAVNSG